MDLKTEETKAKVKGETKMEVGRPRSPRTTMLIDSGKTPFRRVEPEPLTPTKRDSPSEAVEEARGEDEDPGRNSSGTTGSFEKVEANEPEEDNPDKIPDSQFVAYPVDAPVFLGNGEKLEERKT